jgi:NAD(P)-dependent dehydrogenase (short-subunit alcohol dehydrogenase family)
MARFLIILLGITLLVFIRLVLLSFRSKPKRPVGRVIDAEVVVEPADVPRQSPRPGSGRLRGKCAIVTGAGSGIGRAIALAFAREGAKVALVGRTREKLEEVAVEIGPAAIVCPGDVSKAEDMKRIVTDAVAHLGALNVLVNNAATLLPGTALTHTEQEWDSTMETNVKAVWRLCREAIPHMQRSGGGAIVNISSVLGTVGARNRLAYSTSKGALTLMTKAMALDHAAENIRVNCICPGIVETEMVAHFISQAPDPEAARKQRLALHPLGRFGKPEDVAGLAVYLASDEAAWVTGAAFPVDGGYSAV